MIKKCWDFEYEIDIIMLDLDMLVVQTHKESLFSLTFGKNTFWEKVSYEKINRLVFWFLVRAVIY